MTDTKADKAASKADARGAETPAAAADPKARFRKVMRDASAVRAEANGETRPAARRTKRTPAAKPKAARRGGKGRAAKVRPAKARPPKPAPAPRIDPATACLRSGAALVEGFQTSGALWGDYAKSNLDRGVEAAYRLMTATSMREMIEVQSGWTSTVIGAAFTQGVRLSDVALDTTRKAVEPLAEGADAAIGEWREKISA